jgi:hypothetical protein
MIFRRMAFASAITLLLVTCTSCQTEELDLDGDGQLTRAELLTATLNYLCGEQTDSDSSPNDTPADAEPNDANADE